MKRVSFEVNKMKMLKQTVSNFYSIVILLTLFFHSCSDGGIDEENNEQVDLIEELVLTEVSTEIDTISEAEIIEDFFVGNSIDTMQETLVSEVGWKKNNYDYPHFKKVRMDTVRIGRGHVFEDPFIYFKEERNNVYVIIEEGEYVYEDELWIDAENLIIKGEGKVSLYCDVLYNNVMWVTGRNIVLDNLHLMHLIPGDGANQNCSGRVLAFDFADSVTVVNCDLNGCGLAGLHDNLGNGVIFVEYNYIHNNSLGAYTNIDGDVWLDAIEGHDVFKFKNNLIKNNGFDRILDEVKYDEEEFHGEH